MAPQKNELDAQLRALTEKHDALTESVRQLATHAAVLAIAVRDPQAVPPADLDAAVSGIAAIGADLAVRPPEA